MEYRGRRGRRLLRQQNLDSQANSTRSNLLGGVMNLVATAAVAYIVIIMLQDKGHTHSKQDLNKLAYSIDHIAKQLDNINNNYQTLESKFAVYSQELPQLEEQMAALEALARTIETSRMHSHFKMHSLPPYSHATHKNFNKTMQRNPDDTMIKSATTV